MANPFDIVYSKKNANGTGFDEKTLVPVANSFVICDACGDLSTLTQTSSYFNLTSSYALTASFVATASHAETADWALDSFQAVSASYAPSSTPFGLATGSTYPITSSWAENAINGGTTLQTGSTYPITASWAENAINGGTTLQTGSSYPITSSWAEQSLTASNVSASGITGGSVGQVLMKNVSNRPVFSDTLTDGTGVTSIAFASRFMYDGAFMSIDYGNRELLTNNSNIALKWTSSMAGAQDARLYGTSSFSISSSWAPMPTFPSLDAYLSSSWTGSNSSQFSGTSSFSISSSWAPAPIVNWLQTGSTYPITASWAISASYWDSSSIEDVLANKQWLISTGSTLPITSSYTVSASYVANVTSSDPFRSITLATVNGTASTFMRSDAAPALAQNIAPNWTGDHSFNAGFAFGLSSTTILVSGSTTYTYIGGTALKLATSSSNPWDHRVFFNALTNGKIILLENVGTGSLVVQATSSIGDGTMMRLNGDWIAQPYDQILLRYNGTYWAEIARNRPASASFSATSSYSGYATTASFVQSASYALTSSYSVTSSNALTISGSLVFSGKSDGYFPQWTNNRLSPTSSLYYSASTLYLDGGSGSMAGTASYALTASYAPVSVDILMIQVFS